MKELRISCIAGNELKASPKTVRFESRQNV
jgi:hypothetical protein